MSYRSIWPVYIMMSLLFAGCGSSNVDPGSGSGNSLEAGEAAPDGHQAAQAGFESADNAGGNDASMGGNQAVSHQGLVARDVQKHVRPLFDNDSAGQTARRKDAASTTVSAEFTVQGCQTNLEGALTLSTTGATFDGNIVFNPNACTLSRVISGSASFAATFSLTSRHVEVTENMAQTLVNGDQVSIASGVVGQPTYVLDGNGLSAQGNQTLAVSVNEHRHRLASTGNVVYDVSITTDPTAPLQVVNTYGAPNPNDNIGNRNVEARTIISGQNTLVHNIAHYTAKHTFDALHHTLASCNCPDGGSLTEDVTYTDVAQGSYSRIYTFTACGEASVVTTASSHPGVTTGTTQVTWDSCH